MYHKVITSLTVTVLCIGLGIVAVCSQEEEQVVTEVPVRVGQITRATLRAYVAAYGMVEPEPANHGKPPASARVATPVAGVIAEASCEEGQYVRKGTTLFRLDSRTADAQVEKAKVALEFAQKNFQRKQALMQTENISGKLFEEAQQQLNAARKELASAQTQRSLLQIQAPLSGTVVKINARPGEAVDLNAALVELIDLDRLVVNAAVPSTEVYRLQLGQVVDVTGGRAIPGNTGASPPIEHGMIAFIGVQIDTKTDTVPVRVGIPAGSRLRPGQFVNVRIVVEERLQRLAVPAGSVVGVDGTSVIAVVEGDHAVQRPVMVGLRDGELVEIAGDGLREGMTVVTEGAYGLPKETRVRVLTQ
ncbi:MAG: efflux RND transporter periplasmic adaptor subunit [Deltaproteobacteria bacterium]|nr:efflux RND transporter periplasmic adaptor subunit [Deltaproteobacteria bacterium]